MKFQYNVTAVDSLFWSCPYWQQLFIDTMLHRALHDEGNPPFGAVAPCVRRRWDPKMACRAHSSSQPIT